MAGRARSVVLVLLLLVLVAAAIAGWWLWGRPAPLPAGLLQANGRIEGDHYTVASKRPGRVARILAREGDAVQTGQVLAELDAAEVEARVRQAKAALDGDLDRVKQVVKLTGFVSATPDFTDHPKVVDAASALMAAAFGEAGRHARAAVGCSSLPLGAPVEVEAIFLVE